MATPTRFTSGISTDEKSGPFGMLGFPSPIQYHTYFNDFDVYAAGDWTVTETQAGATQALADGDGGTLLLTNSAADNDIVQMALTKEGFKLASGKKTWFAIRFKVSDATQSDVVCGLHITDTSPVAGAPSDGVWFRKDDGDTNIDLVSGLNSTYATATALGTLADATFVDLAWYFDGKTSIEGYVNGVKKATLSVSSSTTLCTDEELLVAFAIQNGEAAAKTMTVDYVFACKER